MRSFKGLFLVLGLASVALAQKAMVTNESPQFCTGMYSKQDWGGNIEPYIKVDLEYFLTKDENGNSSISIVIFEYSDIDGLGVQVSETSKHYVCSEELVAKGLCDSSELYQFIVNKNVTTKAEVLSTVLTTYGDNGLQYKIARTGYYCVACLSPQDFGSSKNTFKVLVNFQNAFGSLPAADIPKLPLYGLLSIVYAVCLCVYLFQVFKHRSELLLLQKYLAGFFVFLTVESIFTWSLFDVQNNNRKYPLPGAISFYVFFVSLLSSFKTSFSLFLLLIIALGYGVVYPKLNKKLMLKVKILAGCHFIFGVGFITYSYLSTQSQPNSGATGEDSSAGAGSWLVLLTAIPYAFTLVAFYFLILSSLSKTVKLLAENKQIVKLKMYQKLFRLIFASLLLLIFAFVISIILVFNDSLTDSIEKFWKFNNVLTDFWPSCLYFMVFIGIAIIWRPTDTSYLLALSDQVPSNVIDEESSEQPPVVSGDPSQFGNEFEFDDLDSLESAGLGRSSVNPFDDSNRYDSAKVKKPTPTEDEFDFPQDDAIEFDLEREQQKIEQASITSPPPGYRELEGSSFALEDELENDDEEEEAHKTASKSKKE
ncbi:unnamed protein product [Kuraishia capsulata CBS 1993]|uniref:Membrane protein PTM1 n=1 Tax=Kuraishia capsulata CBS 1993 TaxID=1382522 RepID=W6MNI0_9ASCO|nr:uncharacterized protein KUCA_T00004163001 [Kuraishia capsulata CBS 1993]CDK28181.1 unnamed protein product [Kuraishia capsulata CBS 1993]